MGTTINGLDPSARPNNDDGRLMTEEPKKFSRMPYPKKTENGRRLYLVGPGRWVSRQRAHQIWRGYLPYPVSEERQKIIKQRAAEERNKYKENPS